MYFGSKLLDDDNTIADYNIQRGDSIRLVLKESHHYSSEWSMDGQSHWHACTDDGCDAKADEAKHSDTNKDHKCDVCGESYGTVDAKNHVDLKHSAAKAATVNEEGNIEYWY